MFGRGGEEVECFFENGILFEIIFGIMLGIVVVVYVGIFVIYWDVGFNVVFVIGYYKKDEDFEEKWKVFVIGIDIFVIYMGIKNV